LPCHLLTKEQEEEEEEKLKNVNSTKKSQISDYLVKNAC